MPIRLRIARKNANIAAVQVRVAEDLNLTFSTIGTVSNHNLEDSEKRFGFAFVKLF